MFNETFEWVFGPTDARLYEVELQGILVTYLTNTMKRSDYDMDTVLALTDGSEVDLATALDTVGDTTKGGQLVSVGGTVERVHTPIITETSLKQFIDVRAMATGYIMPGLEDERISAVAENFTSPVVSVKNMLNVPVAPLYVLSEILLPSVTFTLDWASEAVFENS